MRGWIAGVCLLAWGCAEGDEVEMLTQSLRGNDSAWLDERRSLAVTDIRILERFSFVRVMNTLARDSRVKGATGLSLFKQWWSTQAPGTEGPRCNQEVDAQGVTLLNTFPYDCRPPPSEAAQAACQSLTDPACAYIPIALFNRFDLAPEDGSTCGEHRILFAKATGQTVGLDRNLLIFEAVIRNPNPRAGIQGCRPLIEAWAALSFVDDINRRIARLEEIFFDGVGRFPPVISAAHYGDNDRDLGQIRTNQFMIGGPPFIWTLREFKLRKQCGGRNCQLLMLPVTDKTNPIGLLFGDPRDPRAAAFQDHLVSTNVQSLAQTVLTDISMNTPDRFNSGQSHSSGSTEMDYASYFSTQREGVQRRLWQALGAIGSSVTPLQLVERAKTQTCAGCHQLSNNVQLGAGAVWPPSLGFVHVSEVMPEQGEDGPRYRVSPLLESTFLPHRSRVMFDFLKERPWRRRGWWGWSVGGRFTH